MKTTRNTRWHGGRGESGGADRRGGLARASRFDWHVVALALLVVLVGLVRIRLLAMPFERDEGEYAYMGRLILDGGLPYRDAYNMKLPGTYAMYAVGMALFGNSPTGVHAALAIVSLGTVVLLFLAFRRLFSPLVGLVAASIYAWLSVSGTMLGMAAHATHFVNLFVALCLWLYSRWSDRAAFRSSALVGLMFGVAVLMKQPAVFLAAFGALIVWERVRSVEGSWRSSAKALAIYGTAAALPYILVVFVMLAFGAFDRFWFWTITYASSYASADTPWELLRALFGLSFGPMFAEYPAVWLLAGAGLVLLWVGHYTVRQRIFATGLALASAAALLPGLNFRQHYFVVLLPAVGLLAAIALEWMVGLIPAARSRGAIRTLPFAAVVVMVLFAVSGDRGYYLNDSPDDVCRRIYAGNPFVEAVEIGTRIAGDTVAADTIAVVGSEPEIFLYANRRSATGYLYVYPLVEPQPFNVRMQHEMIAEIEAAQPKYLVYCNIQSSWAATPESPKDILEWFNRFAPSRYEVVGTVEMSSGGGPSRYYWNAEARARGARPNSVWLLRRRG
jgi:4-amino-4-deoxy-L-arabinose transferase-like glycosyltransferase